MVCHLHSHSYYSFLEGIASPEELVRTAAAYGMTALALTDHLSLTGAISFYRACKNAGIKPILGLEVDLLLSQAMTTPSSTNKTGGLVLLATDQDGWKNISRISSALLSCPDDAPECCTVGMLSAYSDGIICLTGGCRGIIQQALSMPQGEKGAAWLLGQLKDIFTDRLYIEHNDQVPGGQMNREDLAEAQNHLSSRTLDPICCGP